MEIQVSMSQGSLVKAERISRKLNPKINKDMSTLLNLLLMIAEYGYMIILMTGLMILTDPGQ